MAGSPHPTVTRTETEMTTEDTPASRRGIVASWLATIVLAMVVSPATAAIAWLASAPAAPLADAMSWPDVRMAAFRLGLLAPILLVAIGVPITRLLLRRSAERLLGAHPTSPVDAHRHLRRAAERAGRRQNVVIELRLLEMSWTGPVALPAGDGRILLALPPDTVSLDDDALDSLITPVVHTARRRPAESRFRVAVLGPVLAVQAFWRTITWQPRLRVPLLASFLVAAVPFVPSGVAMEERILVAPLLSLSLIAVFAAIGVGHRGCAATLRRLTDRVLGDPADAVTSPAWVIDLREREDETAPGPLGPTEAPA